MLIGFNGWSVRSPHFYTHEKVKEREREKERERRGIKSIAHHVLFLFFEESRGDIFVTQ